MNAATAPAREPQSSPAGPAAPSNPSAGFLTADVRVYLCSLPLLSSGCEMSYFQTHLLLFVRTLSFQRATEGSVGTQSTAKRFRDVTGVFSGAAASHRQHSPACGELPPPQPWGAGRRAECDLRCPGVTLARQGHHSPCPGGTQGRVGQTQHIQAFLRQFPVKVSES